MARARNIKPGFFSNEDLVELDFATRLLFIGLWTEADREGRLEDRPKRLKMALFPADNLDVDAMLGSLERLGFIRRYAVGELRIVQIVNWAKHQNPHHTEKPSVLPAEPEASIPGVSPDNGELTVNEQEPDGEYLADSLIPDSIVSHSLNAPVLDAPVADRGLTTMTLDWVPPERLLRQAAQRAGLALALFDREGIAPFVVHHAATGAAKTEAQWVASLVGWVLRDQRQAAARGNVRPFPAKPVPAADADWTVGVVL